MGASTDSVRTGHPHGMPLHGLSDRGVGFAHGGGMGLGLAVRDCLEAGERFTSRRRRLLRWPRAIEALYPWRSPGPLDTSAAPVLGGDWRRAAGDEDRAIGAADDIP
jgi:hypothetical protein